MIALYDYILSAECYAIRLFLGMLGQPFELRRVDVHPGRENLEPPFLAINPTGEIPVIEDGDFRIADQGAILAYLARTYDAGGQWCRDDGQTLARIVYWLAFANGPLAAVRRLRERDLFAIFGRDEVLVETAAKSLLFLEDALSNIEIAGDFWLAGDQASIADIAVFPAVALCTEAGFSFETMPAVWRWAERFKRLPGFSVMPGILPVLVVSEAGGVQG